MRSAIEYSSDTPDMDNLRADWHACVQDRDSNVWQRLQESVDTRNCYWPGQSADGKRHVPRQGETTVFPWKGAADSRVHLADLYVNANAAMRMAVWRKNQIHVRGTESTDDAWSRRLTQLLRWMRYTQIKEYANEARHLANLLEERGAGVMGVWWVQQHQMGYNRLEMSDITELAVQGAAAAENRQPSVVPGIPNSSLVDLPAMVADPTREDEVLEVASALYPQTPVSTLRRELKVLREGGVAKIPIPYTRKNRPVVCAMALNEDVFLPPEATDLGESCTSVHWVERVSREMLLERVRTMGWDKGWVHAVVSSQPSTPLVEQRRRKTRSPHLGLLSNAHPNALLEVVHTYRRQINEDGVPGITYTCWHPSVKIQDKDGKSYAYHGLLGYDHGEYPFVLFVRERKSRLADESRGTPEITRTWQDGIKAEWDGRRDRNSLALLPPSFYPPGGRIPVWGPGAQVATPSPDRYGFFQGPAWDPGSREMSATILAFADRYMGRVLPDGSNAQEAQWMQQDTADTWMEGLARVDEQILALCQQFLPEEIAFRVVGSESGRVVRATRSEIQGSFDIAITYALENLIPDTIKQKIEVIIQSLQLDDGGMVNRAKVLEYLYSLVDSSLGEMVLRPEEEGHAMEVEDEANVFARLYAGVPVDVKPKQAHAARLQWLQNMLAQNVAAQQRYGSDEQFRALVDQRMKQLEFQVQQRQNAQIGRLGG